MLAGGIASLVAAIAQDFALLVVARTLSGLFFAAVVPTAITYLADTIGAERRQHALAVMMAFATSGLAAATIAGGVAAELIGWRAAFVATRWSPRRSWSCCGGSPSPRERGPPRRSRRIASAPAAAGSASSSGSPSSRAR